MGDISGYSDLNIENLIVNIDGFCGMICCII